LRKTDKDSNLMSDNGPTPILDAVTSPLDVQKLEPHELEHLADEIRRVIIHTVSENGGHLAPSLGVVDLTLALLKNYDPAGDRIIWDVGHQAYAYKILTGRRDRFRTLRQKDGLSGFPKMAESPQYDHFGVGHSSTSISAALGMACARDLKGEDYGVVAVIGDGSMTAGLAYEGLNQAGGMEKDLVVVLNDNEMSISRNVGALSAFLSRNLSSPWLVRFKKELEGWLKHVPRFGDDLVNYAKRSEDSFMSFFTPGTLFLSFGFNYLGPIDGHDLEAMTRVFRQVQNLKGPVLVHVLTRKGKGYEPAESNPTYFHGVGCFEPETGEARKFGPQGCPSYTRVFGDTLCKLARDDDRIVAITAAMPEGTGLACFSEAHPERFVDVGICEQHAVTYAAGMAKEGFKPVVTIYSTFMQRSYDQIVHDVCLQNLDVTFCLDRGGLVGEDGPTHHGTFDLSFMRHIPGMVLMAPANEPELRDMVATAIAHPGPAAVRYPRGAGTGVEYAGEPQIIPLGQGVVERQGEDALVVAIGSRVFPAVEAAKEIEAETGRQVGVFNSRFVKPLPKKQLGDLLEKHDRILLVEENVKAGGFGSAVLEFLAENDLLQSRTVRCVGIDDMFVEHGKQKELRRMLGIDKTGIKKTLLDLLG
jgi:1-deoxy-D-xylulose-5-phosphate synthase